MTVVRQGSGEDIGFAPILQLQSLAQFCYRERKVAGGNIGLHNALQMALEFFLVEGRNGTDTERTAWKISYRKLAHEKVTVLGEHRDRITLGKNSDCLLYTSPSPRDRG